MRVLLAFLLLLSLATFAPAGLHAPPWIPATPQLTFQPVALRDDGGTRAGSLIYLGGWALFSDDPRFGGVSAIAVAGGRVRAATDAGALLDFALPPAPGALTLHALAGPGPATRKANRDVEAMAVDGARLWLAFEVRNAVWRYRAGTLAPEAGARPLSMRRWRATRGAEAMLRLADGRFLIFAEGESGAAITPVLLFDGDPAEADTPSVALRYRPPPGYRITDAAQLSDGRLLFLNRRLGATGFVAKLTRGRAPKLAEGALLSGAEIADFSGDVISENLEALSVTQENGRDTLWIASDDNFSPRQRTLLLKFALAD